ncbi:MAG: hypothetical protein KC502_19565 [Myxococcales bacterium]|nr:hypothetical protein [Myxococcales bacterium]
MLRHLLSLLLATLLVSCGGASVGTSPKSVHAKGRKSVRKHKKKRRARKRSAKRRRKRKPAPLPPVPLDPRDPRATRLDQPIYDPSGQAMAPFHAALARAKAGKGQAKIAFWGASHTAADLWTGHVRRALQMKLGDAGHGYMMPVRWHLGLRHQDVNVKASKDWKVWRHRQVDPVPVGDYGYGGVAVQSDDPEQWVRFSTCVDNICGRKADVVEVWIRTSRKGGTLLVTIDGETHKVDTSGRKRQAKELRWKLPDGAHTVELKPAGDGPVYLYGVVMERQSPGVVLDQMGIPGMRGSIQLHWREKNWRRHVQRRSPDLLVLAYGTNAVGDTHRPIRRFVARWRRVLQRIKRATPGAACLLVGPTDRPHRPDSHGVRRHRRQQDLVIAAQKKVAAEFGCGFWDAAAAMGGRGGMLRWVAHGLGRKDHVHLSRAGYALKAERFLWALLQGSGITLDPKMVRSAAHL